MAHTGKYLQQGIRVSTPGVIISVHLRTSDVSTNEGKGYTERCFAYAAASISTKTRGKWSEPTVVGFDNPILLHNWIRTVAKHRKRNYIVCNCASDVLWLTEYFNYAEQHGILFTPDAETMATAKLDAYNDDTIFVRRLCLRGKPDIFSYSQFSKCYLWLSLIQYIDVSDAVLSNSFTHLFPRRCLSYRDSTDDRKRVAYKSVLNLVVFREICKWWALHAKAPFGLTAGQLSMGVLRSYVKKSEVSSHTNATASQLERIACYGGRQSLWYMGAIGSTMARGELLARRGGSIEIPSLPGPIKNVDIVSMYPTLLRDNLYPCKLVRTTGAIPVSQLYDLQEHYGTIAAVRIYADNAEYPLRTEKGLIYPRGTFKTCLAGPDLEAIKDKDRILEVYDCALYTLGNPFKSAASFLINCRLDAIRHENKAWELFAKLVANNMGGKFAQRKGLWVDRPEMTGERLWGNWADTSLTTGITRHFRATSGLVQEYIRCKDNSGPYTFAFAYLTAYGRQLMRRVRACFSPNTILQQDTDGLWIQGELPTSKLEKVCGIGDQPGQIRIKETSSNGLFISPQHYYVDSGWILSGFHNATADISRGSIEYTFNINPLSIGAGSLSERIREYSRTTFKIASGDRDNVSATGWIANSFIHVTNSDRGEVL